MAITTLNGALAGMQPMRHSVKNGITMAAISPTRGYTHWYTTGIPGAATASATGVNGAALTPASAGTQGAWARENPAGGLDAYIAQLMIQPNQSGVMLLVDRLWHNSGLSTTLTTAQSITPAALPARDRTATTNGNDVIAALEWSATGGAGTPFVTLTYTDQDGNAGASATLSAVTTPPVGTLEFFSLAAGDTGIRAPTSFIQTATRTSGAFHLVLMRILAAIPCNTVNIPTFFDVLTGGRPEIWDDSVLQLIWLPSATSAVGYSAWIRETHG